MNFYIEHLPPCSTSYMQTKSPMRRLQRIGPIFRAKDAFEAGVSWRDLYDLRDTGQTLPLSRGLYQSTERICRNRRDRLRYGLCSRSERHDLPEFCAGTLGFSVTKFLEPSTLPFRRRAHIGRQLTIHRRTFMSSCRHVRYRTHRIFPGTSTELSNNRS